MEKYVMVSTRDFAKMIYDAPHNTRFDFTFDDLDGLRGDSPSAWHGVMITSLFDEEHGIIAIGYYGGGSTQIFEIESHFWEDKKQTEYGTSLIESALNDYADFEGEKSGMFCLEVNKYVNMKGAI